MYRQDGLILHVTSLEAALKLWWQASNHMTDEGRRRRRRDETPTLRFPDHPRLIHLSSFNCTLFATPAQRRASRRQSISNNYLATQLLARRYLEEERRRSVAATGPSSFTTPSSPTAGHPFLICCSKCGSGEQCGCVDARRQVMSAPLLASRPRRQSKCNPPKISYTNISNIQPRARRVSKVQGARISRLLLYKFI